MKWTFSEKGTKYLKKIIKEETVWVATYNEMIIGYLAGSIIVKPSYVTKTLAEIDNFYINDSFRGKGIGKRLLQEFKEYCKSNGIEEIKVTANSMNKNAINFYKNNGFDDFEETFKCSLIKINL